jgi:5-methylcytosine-specific restriction endonuclease McrA
MRKIPKNIEFSSKIPIFKKKRSKILYEIRKITKKYPKIKQKIKKIKDLDKKLYYARVWEVTESQPLYILENSNKRGWKNHHLDHVFPIALAYHKKLSPKRVGNIKNLQFIPYQDNLIKGSKLTTESKNALRRIKRLK